MPSQVSRDETDRLPFLFVFPRLASHFFFVWFGFPFDFVTGNPTLSLSQPIVNGTMIGRRCPSPNPIRQDFQRISHHNVVGVANDRVIKVSRPDNEFMVMIITYADCRFHSHRVTINVDRNYLRSFQFCCPFHECLIRLFARVLIGLG